MSFLEKGKFNFTWNELEFKQEYLWYRVRDSLIHFSARPIDKIIWTTEKSEMPPDAFARSLLGIQSFKLENNKLTLRSTVDVFVFTRLND